MFNKKEFANILKRINDSYPTQTDFSDKTINRTNISQYINMRLNSPPKPNTLRKIADNSNGITDYDELMEICGYIDKSTKIKEIEKLEDIIYNKFLEARKLKEEQFKEDNKNNKSLFKIYYSNDYYKFLGEERAFNEVLDIFDELYMKYKGREEEEELEE